MFEKNEETGIFVDGPLFELPSAEQMEKVKGMIKEADSLNDESVFLMKAQFNLLKMRGEAR